MLDEIYRSSLSKRDLKPSGTLFSKICMRPWIRSLSNILPKSPLRDNFLAQSTIPISLRACRRPSILSPVKPLRHQTLETPFRRFNKVPIPWGGPEGTQGNPRVPKGTEGRLRRPWGGMGPRGPLGLYRSHSEWNPVSTGRYLRREGHSFRKKAVRMERPFRMDGSSEWKAVPCVHTAAETPNRMSADLVGF